MAYRTARNVRLQGQAEPAWTNRSPHSAVTSDGRDRGIRFPTQGVFPWTACWYSAPWTAVALAESHVSKANVLPDARVVVALNNPNVVFVARQTSSPS
jgi:hypothetical protein